MKIRKSGMISIVDRPNVGKSTLTNALMSEKTAIVTNKPQTTRSRTYAVVNREGCQFVFLDTPGLHKVRARLGDYMVKVVKESVADVGVVLPLVEPIPHIGGPEAELTRRIKEPNAPAVLVINKISTVEKEELLSVIQVYGATHDFAAIVSISVKRNEGMDELLGLLTRFLPEGSQLFPEGMVADQPEHQVCARIIWGKLLLRLDNEIPHDTAVEITTFSERNDDIIDLDATIHCEEASHRRIITGKGGTMLKKISALARADIEVFIDTKVLLQTWVKAKENWRDNTNLIKNFRYRGE